MKELLPKASESDIQMVFDVLEAIVNCQRTSEKSDWVYTTRPLQNEQFILRVARAVEIITVTDVARIMAVSSRVASIQFLPETNKLVVTMFYEGKEGTKQHYIPPDVKSPVVHPVDWGVEDADDCAHLDAILDDVCNIHKIMPIVDTWVEDMVDGAYLKGRSPTDRADEKDRVGYALCVSKIPDMNLDFVSYLKTRHQHIMDVFVWVRDNDGEPDPMLVVLVRRVRGSREAAAQVAGSFLPVGGVVRAKRRKL